MKKTKFLVPSVGCLLLTLAASVTGTAAWFSANKNVSATGMMVKAKATGSLVISKDAPNAGSTAISYNFNETSATTLYASTHDWSNATSTLLKYVSNAENVSLETGLPYTSADTLTYEDATAVDEETIFYKDYSVFISSCAAELTNQKIEVSLTNPQDLSINGAMSIDFYASSDNVSDVVVPSSSTYKGTLNLAQYDAKSNDCSINNKFSFATSDKRIAQNSEGIGISVLMRVYYDGALKDKKTSNEYILTNKGIGTAAIETICYDNRCGKITVPVNGDLSKYYLNENVERDLFGVVSTYKCDTTFARTVSAASLKEVSLSVSFTAVESLEKGILNESLPGDNEIDFNNL